MLSVWETQMECPELCQPWFQSRAPHFGDISGCFGGSCGSNASGGNTPGPRRIQALSPALCSCKHQILCLSPPKTPPMPVRPPTHGTPPPQGCSARPCCGAWGSAMRPFGDAPMLCSAACSTAPRQRLTKAPAAAWHRFCAAHYCLSAQLIPGCSPPRRGRQPARGGGGW